MLRRETARLRREQHHVTPEIGAADASMSAEWHDFLDTLRDIVSSDEFWTLILHYHFDYSYGEIADLLDKEANAVRQIAHRGRRKCREHLTRLEGRVPAWVMLPDAGPESGGRVAESSDGDPPGLREPRKPDPADRSRRPSAGSDSAQAVPPQSVDLPTRRSTSQPGPDLAPPAATSKPASTWRRRPRLRPHGPGRLFGNPTTVVPLALVIALPLLFQVDRALDATVARPIIRTAQLVDDPGGTATPPPSGPTISVTASTAPTDEREAPSTSAPPPDSSDPPTTPSSSTTSSSTTTGLTTTSPTPTTVSSTTNRASTTSTAPATTTSATPTTSQPTTTRQPTTTGVPTTRGPTTASSTTAAPTTASSTTAPTTSAASSSTSRPTTSTSATSTSTTAINGTTTSATTSSSTTSTPARPTTTTSTTTTSGRDPGNGGDPPPNQ